MGPQIAKFMGTTWGPPGSCRPQMGPMLAPWSLLSGTLMENLWVMLMIISVSMSQHRTEGCQLLIRHRYMQIYMYIYVYIYVCVFVCIRQSQRCGFQLTYFYNRNDSTSLFHWQRSKPLLSLWHGQVITPILNFGIRWLNLSVLVKISLWFVSRGLLDNEFR